MLKIMALASGLLLTGISIAIAGDAPPKPADCPMHAQHVAANGDAAHGAEVDHRHDTLGMSHGATRHSFRLFGDGGAIELRANDAGDTASIDAIRKHLQEVMGQFQKGDFSTPAFIHGTAPDGVADMKRLQSDIGYRFEPLETGGRIRITAKSADALSAVHDFLRFQVIEHRTGDSGNVEADAPRAQ